MLVHAKRPASAGPTSLSTAVFAKWCSGFILSLGDAVSAFRLTILYFYSCILSFCLRLMAIPALNHSQCFYFVLIFFVVCWAVWERVFPSRLSSVLSRSIPTGKPEVLRKRLHPLSEWGVCVCVRERGKTVKIRKTMVPYSSTWPISH